MENINYVIIDEKDYMYFKNIEQVINIKPIKLEEVKEKAHSIFFISGLNLENPIVINGLYQISQTPNAIVLIPPFKRKMYSISIKPSIEINIKAAKFNKLKIVDYDLSRVSNLYNLMIFYKDSINSNMGNTLITSENNDDVLIEIKNIKIQCIYYITTLFIGPSAIKTNLNDLAVITKALVELINDKILKREKVDLKKSLNDYDKEVFRKNLKLFILCLKEFYINRERFTVNQVMKSFRNITNSNINVIEIIKYMKEIDLIVENENKFSINYKEYMSNLSKYNLNSYFKRI